jgi:hypothetical protein
MTGQTGKYFLLVKIKMLFFVVVVDTNKCSNSFDVIKANTNLRCCPIFSSLWRSVKVEIGRLGNFVYITKILPN